MEVDHIFICTKYKAEIVDKLVEFGFVEGSSNVHPGQGTANRRFFFANAMLEFLWMENEEEICSSLTKPMRLYERCNKTTLEVSPFGIAFRPTSKEEIIPFKTWDYHPIYLPDFLKIEVADSTPLIEPLYFYLSFATKQGPNEPIKHKIGVVDVTGVEVTINHHELSNVSQILDENGSIKVTAGDESLIIMEFDKKCNNKVKDFRPDIPLIIKW